jgi:Fe-S cluster biogenesis protein NfuA
MAGVRGVGERVEELLASLRSAGSEAAADELVRLIVGLYGDGLTKIMAVLLAHGEPGAAMIAALTGDPLVESLLLLHDLHPLDVDQRIQRAIERVRQDPHAHADGVEFLGVAGGVARLRIEGGSRRCASSTATARLAVETAVMHAAPEVERVLVEVTDPPPTLLQIGSRPPAAPAGRRQQPEPAGRRPAPVVAQEKCELCAAVIPAGHGHVADLEHSSLICACQACYLLFTNPQAAQHRFRAITDRYLTDPAHPLRAADLDGLEIPVGLAFFLRRSGDDAVTCFYPSPAGATECRLDLRAWDKLAGSHPLLAAAAPDVEAVLISRADGAVESFVVPVDACYELVGKMRLCWRGFDGGAAAKDAVAELLRTARARARVLGRER